MGTEASPFWQNAFLVGGVVAMGWCVWSGWRIGVVRGAISLAGMVAGGVVGLGVGAAVGTIAGSVMPLAGGLIGLASGIVAGLAAYAAICFFGALLFKRTAQQRTTVLRLGYGLGGAAIGAFVGISIFWGALLFVRGLGGFCEGTVDGRNGFYALPMPEGAARVLVKLKRSVEAGSTGKFLESIDVMPPEYYRIFDKFGRLVADPEAVRKFMTYPAIQEILIDAHFLDLTEDPEIQKLGRAGNGSTLMTHPKLLTAVKDPALLAKLQKIDVEKALDYALSVPEPKNPPHP